jgi:polyphosphate kinase 2 (PPK2 family)
MSKDSKNNKRSDEAEPAATTLKRKQFEEKLYELQVELTRLQAWALAKRARVIVVFEGRDTAGKGGVIKRITERCSPRVFKHVALPAPSDREKSQLYIRFRQASRHHPSLTRAGLTIWPALTTAGWTGCGA